MADSLEAKLMRGPELLDVKISQTLHEVLSLNISVS